MKFQIFSAADPDPLAFAPPLLRLQESMPNPLGRAVLKALVALLVALILWAAVGRLDIVAVAEGKLVPQSYLKIVQPAESGIVKDILVREGEVVRSGQVLMRMDALVADADARSLDAEYRRKRLTLVRIDAELGNKSFRAGPGEPAALVREVEAQYRADRAALEAALAEERSRLVKASHDLSSAEQVKTKLVETLPHYQQQDKAYEKLVREGYAGGIMGSDKRRERIEKEQELKTQEFMIESTRASILQSEKKLAQIDSDYRRALYAERNDTQSAVDKLAQELAKQAHKQELLELKAPPPLYKALVALKTMHLTVDGERFNFGAGMQANAEILLGTRTVMEYLLSPVRKAWHEAGRER